MLWKDSLNFVTIVKDKNVRDPTNMGLEQRVEAIKEEHENNRQEFEDDNSQGLRYGMEYGI